MMRTRQKRHPHGESRIDGRVAEDSPPIVRLEEQFALVPLSPTSAQGPGPAATEGGVRRCDSPEPEAGLPEESTKA